jgi:cytochrome oxidase Cu insertion factor (SCO1/SenC/PrrC family)
MNFVFTQCSGACPVQTHRLKRLKQQLEARHPDLGLKLVSISLTPELDTAEVLAGYASGHGIPQDGSWFFLTGEKQAVGAMMDALGMRTSLSDENILDHLTNFYLFDREGRLKKQYDGVAVPEKRLLGEVVSLSRVSH